MILETQNVEYQSGNVATESKAIEDGRIEFLEMIRKSLPKGLTLQKDGAFISLTETAGHHNFAYLSKEVYCMYIGGTKKTNTMNLSTNMDGKKFASICVGIQIMLDSLDTIINFSNFKISN